MSYFGTMVVEDQALIEDSFPIPGISRNEEAVGSAAVEKTAEVAWTAGAATIDAAA